MVEYCILCAGPPRLLNVLCIKRYCIIASVQLLSCACLVCAFLIKLSLSVTSELALVRPQLVDSLKFS